MNQLTESVSLAKDKLPWFLVGAISATGGSAVFTESQRHLDYQGEDTDLVSPVIRLFEVPFELTDRTFTQSEVDESIWPRSVSIEPDSQVNINEKSNTDRIELLARKYANEDFSQEETARLSILTERIKKLYPRVTEADIKQMAAITNSLEKLIQADTELRRDLNIG